MKKIISKINKWFHNLGIIFWGILIDFIFKRMIYKSDWVNEKGQWNIAFMFEPDFITRIIKVPFRHDTTNPDDGIFNFTQHQLNTQWLFKDVKLSETVTVDFYILAKDIKVRDMEKRVRHELLANSDKIEIPTSRIVDVSVSVVNRNKIQKLDEILIFNFLKVIFENKSENKREELIPKAKRKPKRKLGDSINFDKD